MQRSSAYSSAVGNFPGFQTVAPETYVGQIQAIPFQRQVIAVDLQAQLRPDPGCNQFPYVI